MDSERNNVSDGNVVGAADEAGAPQAAQDARSKRGTFIALALLVVVLFGAFFAYDAISRQAKEEQAASAASQLAPHDADLEQLSDYNATVYTDTGEPVTVVELAADKPLVMNFWATWCPHCVREMPDFQEIYEEYGDRVSFAFVNVTDGTRETVELASSWVADKGYDLPVFYDTKLDASGLYGIRSLPTTVIAARNGDIMDISPGAINPALMRKALDSLLEQ